MPETTFLQDLLILLILALASGFLFSRLRLSPIIGYLVTGLLVGPFGFHLIRSEQQVEAMAEIGVILLLFTIGLEFSVSRMLRLKGLMLRCGTLQVLLTGLLVFAGARFLGMGAGAALALGMALALSSTAIVLKLLLERGEIDSAHGRITLSILIYQDLAVVFFLVALPLLGGGRENSLSFLILLKAAALIFGLFVFSRYLLQPLLKGILRARSPELFRLTILAVILGTAWVTGQAGLSLELGAFLAGLALAESDYSHQALSDILPFRDTFLALFFISIGMLVDIRALASDWPLVLGFLAALTLLKVVTGTVAGLFSSYPLRTALLAGLLLFQVGEFSFVLLKEALALQVMPAGVYQVTLSVIALSMMLTPLVIGRASAMATGIASMLSRRREWAEEVEERTANLEGHVIIAGYGVSGRSVGRVMREMHLPYIHVELNGESVQRARAGGEFIIYGDITSPTMLEGVGVEKARALVLAINDPSALARATRAARELNPDLYILVRTRFILELDHLRSLGADEVIPDEVEASLQLSAVLLRRFGIGEGKILKLLSKIRQEHYGSLRGPALPVSLRGYLSVLEEGQIDFQAVPDDSPCIGQTLAELAFRSATGATVVGVIRNERVLYGPNADLALAKGDTLLLLGSSKNLADARNLLHGHPM